MRKALWTVYLTLMILTGVALAILIFVIIQRSQTPPQEITSLPTAIPTITPSATPATSPQPPTPTRQATATNTPAPPTATPSPTLTLTPTPSPTPIVPRLVAPGGVNVRLGPGLNYPVVDGLSAGEAKPIVGRNEAGSWWQVPLTEAGQVGWVANSVVDAENAADVPIVPAPPTPQPTVTPTPDATATPTRPAYQYEATGWYSAQNYGLTRFLGSITDAAGNPVDGVFVEAQCGSYRVLSNPSGPVALPPFYESSTWPSGFYDITVDTRPIPCMWLLTIVSSADGKTAAGRLSETMEVEVTVDASIITANWRKNW